MNRQAQDVIRCSTCDDSVSISCRSCGLDFCNVCIGDHLSETLTEHDVVLFEEKFTREVILPECDRHRHQTCTLVCKVCDVPICTTCFTKNHRKHKVDDLVEAVNQKRAEVETDLRNISDFISHSEGMGSDIEEKVDKVGKNCGSFKSQLESDGLTLQNRIQQNLERGKESIDTYEKNTQELLRSFEVNVNSRTDLLLHKKKEKEMLLRNNVALQIMGYVTSDSSLTEIPPPLEIEQIKIEIEETEENSLLGNIVNDIPQNTMGCTVVLEADEDFDGDGEGDLKFNISDPLLVDRKTFNKTTGTHVMGIHLVTGQFGYIPRSHVAARRSPRQCDQLQRWWIPVGKKRIKQILLNEEIQIGTFCISDYTEDSYNLSVKCNSRVINVSVSKKEDTVSVQGSADSFTNLTDLVHFYQEEREGFPCKLSTPLHHQMPTIQFDGLKVDRDQVNIISGIALERLPGFDMFEGRSNADIETTIRVYKLLEFVDDIAPGTTDANEVVQESENMRQLSHENVLQFVALSTASYPLVMITEFVRQSLLQYLKTELHWQHISLQTIGGFAAQISSAMDYCHRKKIIHMNLCAESVFMDDNLVVKIGGLHAAKRVDVEPFQMPKTTRTRAQWASPEVLIDNTFSRKSDVWSFGVLLYEMVTFGGLPYSGKTDVEIRTMYGRKIKFPHPSGGYLKCPDSYYEIMESCCNYEATSRPSFDKLSDIFKNYFISQWRIAKQVRYKSDGHGAPQLQRWWNTEGKDEVSDILLRNDVKLGTFFISEDTGDAYTLSVKTIDSCMNPTVKHITIFKLDGKEVCVNKDKTFSSLNELIENNKATIESEIKCLLRYHWRDSPSNIAYNGVELTRHYVDSLQLLGKNTPKDSLNCMYNGVNKNGEKVTVFKFKEFPIEVKWSQDIFIEAANIQNGLSHENILGMIGCCSTSNPVFMVTEPIRWVLHHLLKFDMGQSLKIFDLVEFASQIANGMSYLSSKNYIHRDLRAMNIFLTQTFEVKIGGLNLCKDVRDSSNSRACVAIRWTAPEIFQDGNICLKSDVWSFGVLLFEIITFGMHPYKEMSNQDVQEKIQKGYRIPRPSDDPVQCPKYLYQIMKSCWDANPEDRPSFESLHKLLMNYFK